MNHRPFPNQSNAAVAMAALGAGAAATAAITTS